nr:aminoglycoside phosphotransferase family protein [Allorhizobium sonneratiae]
MPLDLVRHWGLSDIVLIADTRTSLVYRAGHNGKSVIVKALKPEGIGERSGFEFLRWRNGKGAVRIIEQSGDIVLLEDAGTLLLRDYHGQAGDKEATKIVVDVLARLHIPSASPLPPGLIPLHVHFRELFSLDTMQLALDLRDILVWCTDIARELLAHQDDIKPLHGDLHHDNIIGHQQGGWRSIDPHGLIGDPAYDCANIFGNPLNAARLVLDQQRAIDLSRCFATALKCSPQKILRYAAAHAGLSCAWILGRPLTPSGHTNLEERLGFARLARFILLEQFVD